jgi:hypothetical protein
MVLTYRELRHVALCCLQTNVLFPWPREPVHFVPDTRSTTAVHVISWTVLHYSHMRGWKWSCITFNWQVYCSGLNFSKWSRQLCICKCMISLMYMCHLMWVYSKDVLKWFMWWTCDNSVKWWWPSLCLGTSHCVVCRQLYCLTDW